MSIPARYRAQYLHSWLRYAHSTFLPLVQFSADVQLDSYSFSITIPAGYHLIQLYVHIFNLA